MWGSSAQRLSLERQSDLRLCSAETPGGGSVSDRLSWILSLHPSPQKSTDKGEYKILEELLTPMNHIFSNKYPGRSWCGAFAHSRERVEESGRDLYSPGFADHLQLTLEQPGFELSGPTYMRIFLKNKFCIVL